MQYFKLPSGVRDILPDESEKLDAAEETLRRTIAEMCLPEADVFLAEFLPAYEQSLDELRGEEGNG